MDGSGKPLTELTQGVAGLLIRRGETIAVSESSMGGLVSAALVAIPGASKYYLGGATIYTHESRMQLLGIGKQALQGIRPATEAYALLCARSIRQRLGSTWALAETGATGPTTNPYMDPPGTAWIALVGAPGTGYLEKTLRIETGDNDREQNMWAFARQALTFVRDTLS